MVDVTSMSILRGQQRDLPDPILLHRYFENVLEQAKCTCDKLKHSVIFQERRVPYREINEMANKAARQLVDILRKRHVTLDGSDIFIAVDLQPSDWLVIILLAILKIGAAYVPVDSQYAINRVRHILNEVQPVCVIAHKDSEFMKGTSTTWSRFHILDNEELYNDYSLSVQNLDDGETLVRHICGDSIACVTYTSGSTGMPKGVRLSHKTIMNRLLWQWHYIPFRDDDEVGCFKTSLLFVDSIVEIFSYVLKLIDIAICPTQFKTNTESFVEFLEDKSVTRLVMVPSLLRNILSYISVSGGADRLRHMRTWVSNSETLTPSLLETFFSIYPNDKIMYNFYGSTETMADVTCEVFRDLKDVQSKTFENRVSIGRPMYNCTLYIVDGDMHVLNQNTIGQICISGLNVASGYMEKDRNTSFGVNTLEEHPTYSNLYQTGDFGLIKDGMVIYQGRRDSQVKIRGHRVDISEIERAVMGHSDAVDKVVVICHEYRESSNVIVAYLTTARGVPLKMDALRASCERSLPSYMIPKLMHVPDIPLQPHTGKVDRVALTQMYHKSFKRQSSEELSTLDHKGRKALAILALNLDIPTSAVSQKSSFFELGGNSVSMMSVIVQMRQYGLHIPIEVFSRAKTVKDIIDNVEPSYGKIPETLHTDRYQVCPLVDVTGSEDIIHILAESFIEKEPLDVLLGVTKDEIMIFSESLYHLALNQNLSFLVRDIESGRIVGGDYLFDYFEDMVIQHHESMAPLLTLLREFESPVKEKLLQSSTGPLLFNYCLCVDKDLPHVEQVIYAKLLLRWPLYLSLISKCVSLYIGIYILLFVYQLTILYIFQYITHVHFYEIKKNTLMLIKMHLITLFRIMNPHQRYLQAKVKYRNEPKTGNAKE